MNNDTTNALFIAGAIIVAVVLGVVSLVIRYQHDRLREKIVERAHQMFAGIDVQRLEEMTDDMLAYEIRSLCSLQDADFRKEVCARLKIKAE